jgi:predicted pyridoxine 5'-phosphate oxidase superfamily flavin-nucleotide-binding protein
VRQSFGNCPKYIQPREAVYVGVRAQTRARVARVLGDAERALRARADTFFVASAHPRAHDSRARPLGVDVSHRGGPPGFIHFVEDAAFIVPDFRGNNFYDTLGNLALNPAAGLLFIDVASGDLLQIDADAQVSAGAHPLAGPDGTGRIVRFVVREARWFAGASPVQFRGP